MTVLAVVSAAGRTPGDNSYFSSLSFVRHLRTGMIDFGSGRTESVSPAPMMSVGMSIGRNYRLTENLRLSLPFCLAYGFANEAKIEHLYLDDGSDPPANLNTVLLDIGIQPKLQAPLRLSEKAWALGIAGAGVHYCMSHEEEWTQDSRHLLVDDPYLEKGSVVTWSVAAGAGLEWALARGRGVFIEYLFRFWYPVNRKTARDLFPLDKMPYRERFLTHSFSFGYMIPRLF